jgi:hypothetical protein
MIEAPIGVLMLLDGLIWSPQPKKSEDEFMLSDDERLSRGQTIAYLVKVVLRFILIGSGFLIILLDILSNPADIELWGGVAFFGVLYGGGILALQRAEPAKRRLVLVIMIVIGTVIWRYANYRELVGEHLWGLVFALIANGVFWLAVGRHHTPQDQIQVITS